MNNPDGSLPSWINISSIFNGKTHVDLELLENNGRVEIFFPITHLQMVKKFIKTIFKATERKET